MSRYNIYVEDISVEAVINKLGGVEGAKRFLSGELVLVEAQRKVAPQPPEPPLDFVVRVNRSAKLSYPAYMVRVMYPELEVTGPAEYDLRTMVETWRTADQSRAEVRCHSIYADLLIAKAIEDQLGLSDLIAIKAKGIGVFRQFNARHIYGWRSVIEGKQEVLYVPYLSEHKGQVVLHWWMSALFCGPKDFSLRFRKPKA